MNERMMILGTVQNQSQAGSQPASQGGVGRRIHDKFDKDAVLIGNLYAAAGCDETNMVGSGRGWMTCHAGQLIELPAEQAGVLWPAASPSSAWKSLPGCWPADGCMVLVLIRHGPLPTASHAKASCCYLLVSQYHPVPLIRICEFPFASVPCWAGWLARAIIVVAFTDSEMHCCVQISLLVITVARAPSLLVLRRVSPLLQPCGCQHRPAKSQLEPMGGSSAPSNHRLAYRYRCAAESE